MDNAYLNFGQALETLRHKGKVAREGWNGKSMWLVLIKPEDMLSHPTTPVVKISHPAYDYDMLPWIGMKTADNKFVPWLASQTDILAEDWSEV